MKEVSGVGFPAKGLRLVPSARKVVLPPFQGSATAVQSDSVSIAPHPTFLQVPEQVRRRRLVSLSSMGMEERAGEGRFVGKQEWIRSPPHSSLAGRDFAKKVFRAG